MKKYLAREVRDYLIDGSVSVHGLSVITVSENEVTIEPFEAETPQTEFIGGTVNIRRESGKVAVISGNRLL